MRLTLSIEATLISRSLHNVLEETLAMINILHYPRSKDYR